MTGREFLKRARALSGPQRENAIFEEIASGNVPDFERTFVRVPLWIPEGLHVREASILAMVDYIAIGSNDDFVRMPMSGTTAQRIADATGCVLPTRKLVDDIYRAAPRKITSPAFAPGPQMTTMDEFARHDAAIERERQRLGAHLGELTAGHKKDVVQSVRLESAPSRVAIYGWFREDGTTVQPLSTVHRADYADYTHGVRLLDGHVMIDGREHRMIDVLSSKELSVLVSDEGPLAATGDFHRG